MIDYNWRSPAQRIEMSNQYGWKPRQIPPTIPGGAPGPTSGVPAAPAWNFVRPPVAGPLSGPSSPWGTQPKNWPTFPQAPGPTTLPMAPGPSEMPVGSAAPFNPWNLSGAGNNPLDYTVPTDSHNVVQIPGLPPVQNPPIESGGPQISNPPGYAHGGVIPPGLERYRKLLKGNWRPRSTTTTDPNSLTGIDTGKITRKT